MTRRIDARALRGMIHLAVLAIVLTLGLSACGSREHVSAPEPVAQIPALSAVDPDSVEAGQEVALVGAHFGTESGVVRFGAHEAGVVSWSDRRLVVKVPVSAVDDSVSVEVGGQRSNKLPYTVVLALPQLVIDHLDPARAPVNTIISIVGSGFVFPRNTPEMKVTFTGPSGRLEGRVTAWNERGIRVWVPIGTIDGPVRVEAGPRRSNDMQFTVATGAR
ncbi:MAG: IPT/TIG domain-containing protein [Candidatus Eisenbacteria bacterium]